MYTLTILYIINTVTYILHVLTHSRLSVVLQSI